MKNFLVAFFFSLVVLSTALGPQQALSENQLLVTAAVGDIKSLILKHIANVTASLAEEYMRDLVALGTDVLVVSVQKGFQAGDLLKCLYSAVQWICESSDNAHNTRGELRAQ